MFETDQKDSDAVEGDSSINGLAWFLPSFHPRSLPLMARLSYNRELMSWSLLPLMLSGLQGGTMAVFVKKTFAGLPGVSPEQLNFCVGIVAASQAIGHLTSFLWASISHGRPKIRFIMWLQVFTAAVIGTVAFAPRSAAGLWAVTVLCIVAWMFWSGVMTLRSGVWRANYHHSYRPSVAGRLSTVHALMVAAAGAGIGFCLDWNPMTYRVLFPAMAAAGIIGAFFYRRVPFRRHSRHLLLERSDEGKRPSLNPLVIARVLRDDRQYRGYMACMFTMGMGNLMLHPLLAIVLTDLFDAGYQTGIAIATVIPLVCMTLAIPFWSRRLERMHVTQYRAIHGWSFVCISTLVILGVWLHQIAFLYLAAVATGFAWGGGVLAWNLGHQHFAPRDRDAEYMGVHITLTGIRGFVGPLLGVQLYGWLAAYDWHVGAFVACLAMNVAGVIGFTVLASRMKHQRTAPDLSERDVREDQEELSPRELAMTTSR